SCIASGSRSGVGTRAAGATSNSGSGVGSAAVSLIAASAGFTAAFWAAEVAGSKTGGGGCHHLSSCGGSSAGVEAAAGHSPPEWDSSEGAGPLSSAFQVEAAWLTCGGSSIASFADSTGASEGCALSIAAATSSRGEEPGCQDGTYSCASDS